MAQPGRLSEPAPKNLSGNALICYNRANWLSSNEFYLGEVASMFRSDRKISLSLAFHLFLLSATVCLAQPPQDTDASRNPAITPQQLSLSFAAVTKMVSPAVVSIDTKGKMPEITARGTKPSEPGDLLDFFNRQLPRRPTYSVGSGFIVDKRGYILTNAHVIADSARITVKLDSGEEYIAKITGVDEETDLAVLKIEAGRELPIVKLGDSNQSSASAIGSWPSVRRSASRKTVTAGIISQTQRSKRRRLPFSAVHSDRRGDQPRKLRRAAGQYERRGDRR